MTIKKISVPLSKGPGADKRPGPGPQPIGKQVVPPVHFTDLSKEKEAPKQVVLPVAKKEQAPQPAPAPARPAESS
jgi:hypothetical protein